VRVRFGHSARDIGGRAEEWPFTARTAEVHQSSRVRRERKKGEKIAGTLVGDPS